MKKYCFTDCFKRKMSKGWKAFTEFIVGATFAILIFTGVVLFLAAIGWIISLFIDLELKQLIPTGFFAVLTVLSVALIVHWIYNAFFYFKRRGTDWIVRKYEQSGGFEEECSIFEECKEE